MEKNTQQRHIVIGTCSRTIRLWYQTLTGALWDSNKRLHFPHLFLSIINGQLTYFPHDESRTKSTRKYTIFLTMGYFELFSDILHFGNINKYYVWTKVKSTSSRLNFTLVWIQNLRFLYQRKAHTYLITSVKFEAKVVLFTCTGRPKKSAPWNTIFF